MTHDVQASRLVVLSDLHLAPPGEQCVFAKHEALVSLLDHLAAEPTAEPPQCLVLNGDVFDFLQIPGYDALSLPLAPRRTAEILDALDAEPPPRNVVQALRRLTAAGHVLCCLPGNHDAELNLVTVQKVLGERLGSSTSLPPSAGQWQLTVAGRTVLGLHGHHTDAFNAIGGTQMRQAQADGDATVPMPPGSRLVCQVINPFRRAKAPDGAPRFPFIDRLPSDQAVVLAVMLLDPRLAGKRLKDALGIGAEALVRKALMATGAKRSMLGATGGTPTGASGESDWMAALSSHLADAAASLDGGRAGLDRIEHEVDAYFAGQSSPAMRSTTLLAAGDGAVRKLLLRAFGRALSSTNSAFRSKVPDTLALEVMATLDPGTVALAGHTHAAKCIATPEGGVYINTGTWVDQVLPPDEAGPEALRDWMQRLQEDRLPLWNGHPVALVDAGGARLMRWDGRALAPWHDALPEAIAS